MKQTLSHVVTSVCYSCCVFEIAVSPFHPLQERFGAPVDTDSEELFRAMSTFLKQFLAARKDLYPDWNPQEYVINTYIHMGR